jgi:hypothetical protein
MPEPKTLKKRTAKKVKELCKRITSGHMTCAEATVLVIERLCELEVRVEELQRGQQ